MDVEGERKKGFRGEYIPPASKSHSPISPPLALFFSSAISEMKENLAYLKAARPLLPSLTAQAALDVLGHVFR